MFLLHSENELIESFQPRDRRRLELPDGLKFPLVVRDYLAWVDTSSHKVHLLFSEPDVRKPLGVIFDRDSGGGAATSAHCEWCHSFGSSNQIGLLTLPVSSTRRVGIHLCRDLSCRDKIENNLSLSPVEARRRVTHVVGAMSRFVRRLLV